MKEKTGTLFLQYFLAQSLKVVTLPPCTSPRPGAGQEINCLALGSLFHLLLWVWASHSQLESHSAKGPKTHEWSTQAGEGEVCWKWFKIEGGIRWSGQKGSVHWRVWPLVHESVASLDATFFSVDPLIGPTRYLRKRTTFLFLNTHFTDLLFVCPVFLWVKLR